MSYLSTLQKLDTSELNRFQLSRHFRENQSILSDYPVRAVIEDITSVLRLNSDVLKWVNVVVVSDALGEKENIKVALMNLESSLDAYDFSIKGVLAYSAFIERTDEVKILEMLLYSQLGSTIEFMKNSLNVWGTNKEKTTNFELTYEQKAPFVDILTPYHEMLRLFGVYDFEMNKTRAIAKSLASLLINSSVLADMLVLSTDSKSSDSDNSKDMDLDVVNNLSIQISYDFEQVSIYLSSFDFDSNLDKVPLFALGVLNSVSDTLSEIS